MTRSGIWSLLSLMAWAGSVCADTQVWDDAGVDNTWSTNAANWDAGSLWTNGNSAVFSGAGGTIAGETLEISNDVVVAGITFQTNGYVIADADANGTLTLAGGPSRISVVSAGDTGTVSEVIAGSSGFVKTGVGQLRLTSANTYAGQTIVSNGTLRLNPNTLAVLGATGAGNETVVAAGATLDLNGCYATTSSSEAFQIVGAGVDGKGALVNYGLSHVNRSVGSLTLLGDATVNSTLRIDAYDVYGNGHTLTKIGNDQFCVKNLRDAEIVINQGTYTLLDDNRALGGTTLGDTTMNGGTLNAWNTMTVSERITFNGGTIQQGSASKQFFTLTGYLTLNGYVTFNTSSPTSGVEVAGYMDGAGGFTQGNAGLLYITGDTNTYSGRTLINSGRAVYVGKTNLYSGVLGTGVVTNWGTINGYSRRITDGTIVNYGAVNVYTGALGAAVTLNNGTLYLRGGELGTGTVVSSGSIVCLSAGVGSGVITNNGGIYFDRDGTVVSSNSVFGSGTFYARYGCDAVLSSVFASNACARLGEGSLSLTNGTCLNTTNGLYVADRGAGYSYTLTNALARFDLYDGASLVTKHIVMGDGANVANGSLAGTINQYGGEVSTYNCTAESNGLRVAHWPQADCTYNMMGGRLTVDNGWDLCIATDGTGWVHQTGGEIYASRVMVHERMNNTQGRGRLTVAGGVLNIGLTNGIPNVEANGIAVDGAATYLVEYGGMGGVVRAQTNFTSSLNATLYGAGAEAITFDTKDWAIGLFGRLSGDGGLNKAGTGTLALSGANTCTGATFVAEGRLLLGAANALTGTAVTVASGAALDLGGFGQALAGVGGAGVVSNGVLAVTGAIEPGTNGVGTLTLATGQAGPVGGTLVVDVTTAGESDLLQVEGDLDLTGTTLQIVDPEQLNTHQHYTIATFTGSLAGTFSSTNLTRPWYVMHDRVNQRVQVRADNGTLIKVR